MNVIFDAANLEWDYLVNPCDTAKVIPNAPLNAWY